MTHAYLLATKDREQVERALGAEEAPAAAPPERADPRSKKVAAENRAAMRVLMGGGQ